MREIGFSKRWDKLKDPVFTTFRRTRKDRDWQPGELVKPVFHPRGPDREVLGVAQILRKEPRLLTHITDAEAHADGFPDRRGMIDWLTSANNLDEEVSGSMNKLTLAWRQPII